MKKLIVLGALAALAASALPGAAAAGRFTGVVVAKDTARHTIAVVSGRQVRTVRSAKLAAVGRRVGVTGARLSDGTYKGTTVKTLGRARQVRFGAVVVRHDAAKNQLIVSAGGTVFGLRYTGATALADASTGLNPGDRVTVSADVGKDGLDAGEGDVKETGHTGQVKIVGIFLRGGQDGFDVAIVHRGQVRVHFTPGTQLPAWQPGDVIVLLVTVNDDGSFTLVQGNTDHDPSRPDDGTTSAGDGGKTTEPTYVDATGVLTAKTDTSVTVTRDNATTLTCTVPSTVSVSAFAVGAKVGLYCKRTDGGFVLVAIKSLDPPPPAPPAQPTSFAGALADASTNASVKGDGDRVNTCAVPAGVSLAFFHVGDPAKMECALHDGKLVLVQLRTAAAWINLATGELGLIGKLADTSVTVSTENASLHCGVATPVDFSLFTVGDQVALSCKRTDSGLVFNLLYGSGALVKADGTIQRTVAGTLTAVDGRSVSVKLEGGDTVICTAPAAADLSAFHVGDAVKMRCNLVSGTWQLSLLASSTATVEIH
jgi:hypothetical protein